MEQLLSNPVFNALSTSDSHLGFGTSKAKTFYEEVSPFAGYEEGYEHGFDELYSILPQQQKHILFANPVAIEPPKQWQIIIHVEGVQMHHIKESRYEVNHTPVPLNTTHVPAMLELTELMKPGPFGKRTIEFGHYYGIFDQGRLVAMAGQRMHIGDYSEISAVCTHPDYLGKGYAASLVQQQLNLIYAEGRKPFLHVKADNTRAVELYERLGFTIVRPMQFYFLKKKG